MDDHVQFGAYLKTNFYYSQREDGTHNIEETIFARGFVRWDKTANHIQTFERVAYQ